MMVKKKIKVTRNFQITIPSEIRKNIGIKEGDILIVESKDNEIILRKPKSSLPEIRLGYKVTIKDIEKYIEESIEEMAG